eukprot:10488707-Alexandrium_andersonii.AAC.1
MAGARDHSTTETCESSRGLQGVGGTAARGDSQCGAGGGAGGSGPSTTETCEQSRGFQGAGGAAAR